MKVTQDLLISTYKENPQVIWLRFFKRMNRQESRSVTILRSKIRYITIRITCDILQSSRSVWLFIKSMYRNYWKHLVNTPGVGQRLKQREVTEIFISKLL